MYKLFTWLIKEFVLYFLMVHFILLKLFSLLEEFYYLAECDRKENKCFSFCLFIFFSFKYLGAANALVRAVILCILPLHIHM